VLAGVGSAAFVCGTLSARFLSTAQTFQVPPSLYLDLSISRTQKEIINVEHNKHDSQVAVLSAMAAAVYMRIFLKETTHQEDASTQPLLTSEPSNPSSNRLQLFPNIPTIQDINTLLTSR